MRRLKCGRVNNIAAKVATGLLLVPAGLLLAGPKPAEKTIATTTTPRVSISNLSGKVEVKGWNKLQVHVQYTVSTPKVAVDTELLPGRGPAEKVHFTTYVVNRSGLQGDPTVNYILQVPTGANLEIHDPQGSVKIESIKGDMSVDSLGGDIFVADSAGHVSVHSVGGNIEIIRSAGRVEAYSINGNLHFVNPKSSRLHGTTTSGTILYEGNFAPGGDYVFSDYSGNINILCPPSASFELEAKTVRGKVDNEFPIAQRGPVSPFVAVGNSFVGSHSTGQATLELTSFSGTIRIRQQQ